MYFIKFYNQTGVRIHLSKSFTICLALHGALNKLKKAL